MMTTTTDEGVEIMKAWTRKRLAEQVASMIGRHLPEQMTRHNISATLSQISQWEDGPARRAEQRLYNAPVGAFDRFCRMVRAEVRP